MRAQRKLFWPHEVNWKVSIDQKTKAGLEKSAPPMLHLAKKLNGKEHMNDLENNKHSSYEG